MNIKVVRIQAENFKCFKVLDIKLNPEGVTVISGKNRAGKSTALEVPMLAIGGPRCVRELTKPIRDGQESGSVSTVLDNGLTATRRWTQNGTAGTLTVTDETSKKNSPRAYLDTMLGDLSFNPFDFVGLSATEQKERVLALDSVDIDLPDIEARRTVVFDQRTDQNRETKRLTAHLDSLESPDASVGDVEVSMVDLLANRSELERIKTDHDNEKITLQSLESSIKSRKSQLAELQDGVNKDESARFDLEKSMAEYIAPDIDSIDIAIANVEKTNIDVRAKIAYNATNAELGSSISAADEMTAKISSIDAEKEAALAGAKLPIDGLTIEDKGLGFHGIPLKQCATTEELRVGIALTMAFNPGLKLIVVPDASLFDEDSIAMLDEVSKEYGYQALIEMVSNGDGAGFRIEEGEVVGNEGDDHANG